MNESINSSKHPVWDIYDEYRTARFNVRYYEYLLANLKRWNFWIELIIALSVSSGITFLWIWSTSAGSIIWKIIITVAAVLSVIKPLVKLSDKIQLNTEVLTKWRALDADFQKLVISISQNKKYDKYIQSQFLKLMETKATIQEPPDAPNNKLRDRCSKIVQQEIPEDRFFIPEER